MAIIHQFRGADSAHPRAPGAPDIASINAAAVTEGWALMLSDTGELQLVALPGQQHFEIDRDAWTQVIRLTDQGSELHEAALRALRHHNRNAFDAVMAWARIVGFWLETRLEAPLEQEPAVAVNS